MSAAALIAIIGVCACGRKENAEDGFKPLFSSDLSNATFEQGVWTMDKDGILRATKDVPIFTKDDYGDFEVVFDFMITKDANSGFFFRCEDPKTYIAKSLEVQIADSSNKEFSQRTWTCGSLFGCVPSEFDTVLEFGKWHNMRVVNRGTVVDAWLNGKHVMTMDSSKWTDNKVGPDGTVIPPWLAKYPKSELPLKGKLGFQGKHGKAECLLKNVKVKTLN